MISQLTGRVAQTDATSAVIDLNGFGLSVLCPPATAASLRPGEQAMLHTSLVVREDSLTLYGFAREAERDLFELVQTASGIGPKIALAVASVLSPADFVRAVQSENAKALTAVPGIGLKGAQKIVIELRDKVLALAAQSDDPTPVSLPTSDELWREQVSTGLQGLGWSAKDAEKACDAVAPLVADDPSIGVAALMRAALRALAH